MFKDLEGNSKKYLSKVFAKKYENLEKYNLEFFDDYDDLFNKLLFNRTDLVNFLKKVDSNEYEDKSLEKVLLNNPLDFPLLSDVLQEYFEIKNINQESIRAVSIRRSLSIMIEICDDKPINIYSKIDAQKFRDHFLKSNKISTGKRNQSNIQNIFSVIFDKLSLDKKNPFSNLNWPLIKQPYFGERFSSDDLKKLKEFCMINSNFLSLICGLIFDTGCTFKEIIGLKGHDINVEKYNPYLIIRSNSFRRITNINKRRIIPLVGVSLLISKKIKNDKSDSLLFNNYFNKSFKRLSVFENKLNYEIKKLTNGKTCKSFKCSLIERLKDHGCPEDIISEIVGLKKKESFYRNEITLEMKTSWLNQIII
jgi:integrase